MNQTCLRLKQNYQRRVEQLESSFVRAGDEAKNNSEHFRLNGTNTVTQTERGRRTVSSVPIVRQTMIVLKCDDPTKIPDLTLEIMSTFVKLFGNRPQGHIICQFAPPGDAQSWPIT